MGDETPVRSESEICGHFACRTDKRIGFRISEPTNQKISPPITPGIFCHCTLKRSVSILNHRVVKRARAPIRIRSPLFYRARSQKMDDVLEAPMPYSRPMCKPLA